MIVPTVERGLLEAAFCSMEMVGDTFDVPALTLGVERVEGERALAAPRDAGEDDEALLGDLQRDALEVVLAGAFHEDGIGLHDFLAEEWGPSRIKGGREVLNHEPDGSSGV
ncbi:MAG: hypothetical protein E6J88_04360 [Deltaproteobacteria bacterium]|nr:MAG: hypothetical protein E6J88_04360 [Deltaproteobacteria bacterium]